MVKLVALKLLIGCYILQVLIGCSLLVLTLWIHTGRLSFSDALVLCPPGATLAAIFQEFTPRLAWPRI